LETSLLPFLEEYVYYSSPEVVVLEGVATVAPWALIMWDHPQRVLVSEVVLRMWDHPQRVLVMA
jgi:hypothetical protein